MRPIITTNTDDHIGLAVIRSLGRNNIDFQVVSKTKETLGYYSRYSRNKTVHPFNMAYFSKLTKDDVVFPMIEETMLLLLKNKSGLQCQLGFSDYNTIQKARDKALLTQHAKDQKIPCPKTYFITKPEDIRECRSELDFPVVLKPNRGSGGKGIKIIDSLDRLPDFTEKYLKDNGPVLLQEKIPFKTKYTVGALLNSEHELRRICVIKELRNYPIDTGQACYVETVKFPRLAELTEKLLKSLDFFGIADIDFLIDERDGQPKLMEVNPRFWGSMQVAINAGVDFPLLLHTMLKEGDIEKSLSYKTGTRCRYLLFNDLFRLIKLLRSDVSLDTKKKAGADFLRFHEDQGYYIYAQDDLMPLLGLINIKLLKKWKVLKKRSSAE